MALDTILIRSTPKITPTQIAVRDTKQFKNDNGNEIFDKKAESIGYSERKGLMTPIVMIGQVRLPADAIESVQVWQTELVPRISITLIDGHSVFGAGGYPLANIITSVFIQSPNKKLKSLAGDYLINNVSSISLPGTSTTIYTISGDLYIPKLNGQFSRSYPNLTSKGVLQKVADELQLGFADNLAEADTKDKMTWIMPNYSYKSFISHIKKMAYADDSNFFDCFIDRYYTLNFINVEKMFGQDKELDKGFTTLVQTALNKNQVDPALDDDAENSPVDIVLSNYGSAKGSESFIQDFSMISSHGEVLVNNGLRRTVYWYDHGGNSETKESDADFVNFIEHYAEPLTTAAGSDGQSPHTVILDEYANSDSIVGEWRGIDYGNAHEQYKFAHIVNDHNLKETQKNMLKIRLDGLNANIIRGSRVAVAIFLQREAAANAAVARKENSEEFDPASIETGNPIYDQNMAAEFYDKGLSGFYYVSSISYTYLDGKFETEMLLARRHWILPRPKNEITT